MAYNTVPFHGKTAQTEKNNVAVGYSVDWSINVALDMADASRQAQSWKEGLPGQAGWSGSCTFHFVAGNTEQKALMDNIVAATPGTKLTDIKWLLEGSTSGFTGNLFLTNMAVSTALGAVVNVSFNFQGDGALTLTDAA